MFLIELSDGKHISGDELTDSSSLHLLCRDSKHRQYFGHDLRQYVRDRCCRCDFCVSLEAGEEAFDPVEEFDKSFAARGSIFRRLREERYHNQCGDIK